MQSLEVIKGSDGSGNANLATVQSTRSPGATTIDVDTVLGINPGGFAGSMGTPHTFTDPITSEVITVISDATAVDFTGHIDGSNIEIDDIAPGYTDAGSAVGDIIIIKPTTQYADNLAAVLEVAHEDDGSLNPAGIHQAMPAGAVVPYAGALAPSGFLLCDGSSKVRADYAALFTAIGTAFGAADGTHFNVPDMRGRGAVGVGSNIWTFTFASTDVNTGTEQVTVTANPELVTGRKVQLTTTGTLPTGLSLATDYYLIVVDTTHVQFASSLANAVAGTAINLTGAGSGTNTATHTGTARTLAEHGGETAHADTLNEVPSHSHAFTSYNHGTDNGNHIAAADGGSVSGPGTNDSNVFKGGSAAHNNMQPYLALNHIIKT